MSTEPIYVEVVRECHFKAKGCKECGRAKSAHRPFDGICEGFRRQNGCDRCGRPKNWTGHFGAPPSYNALGGGRGTGSAAMVGASLKQQWQEILRDLIRGKLPAGLAKVYAEGEVVFPDRGRRDQGNFRVVIEKALGDALVDLKVIEDDDWSRYEFGQLSMLVEPGRSATRLALFPATERGLNPGDQMELT